MTGIERPPVRITHRMISLPLYLSFRPVVAGLAQRLKIVGIPKEIGIATVRHDVINDRGLSDPAKGLAEPA